MTDDIPLFSRDRCETFSRNLVLDVLYRAIDEDVLDPEDLLSAHAVMLNRQYYAYPRHSQRCISVTPPPISPMPHSPPHSLHREPLLPVSSLNNARKRSVKKRYKGFVKCFGAREGYGFITCNELKDIYQQDVFLHHVQVSELGITLTRGDLVEFTVEENANKQPQARHLKRLRAASNCSR